MKSLKFHVQTHSMYLIKSVVFCDNVYDCISCAKFMSTINIWHICETYFMKRVTVFDKPVVQISPEEPSEKVASIMERVTRAL